MGTVIDPHYFQELLRQDPEHVSRRTGCVYDRASSCYRIFVWGDEYAVFPAACRIDFIGDPGRVPHDYFFLFILHYLLTGGGDIEPLRLISAKDLPGGATFFRGPHEIPVRLISEEIGNDMAAFDRRCLRAHGIPIPMADSAFRFDITLSLHAAVLFWEGDEEFTSDLSLLFSESVGQFPLDVVFALAVAICYRIGGA